MFLGVGVGVGETLTTPFTAQLLQLLWKEAVWTKYMSVSRDIVWGILLALVHGWLRQESPISGGFDITNCTTAAVTVLCCILHKGRMVGKQG